MPANYFCDKCGSPDGADEDYDGLILCSFHRTENNLRQELAAYKAKRDWVKCIWLKDLAERRERIAKLKAFLTQRSPDLGAGAANEEKQS